ncbi:MAG TPA: sulfotransferase [Steroidobacteraceae bacterium]|jgi:tetratricopeptide (TPR) repeat protein|nr:sulfotransferase [Steroidobacteraceae bacterium]
MAIAHAKRLLEKNPDLAAEQAREILTVHPAHPAARLILGAAQRRRGRAPQALDVLEPLAREQPNAAPVHLELGVARAEAGHLREAVAALRRAVQLQPKSADGWRILADFLDAAGDPAGAGNARVRYVAAAAHDPRLKEPAAALLKNDLPLAERRLRAHLAAFPTDVAALRMLAEVAGRLRKYAESQELLERCLTLAPDFDAARLNYAGVLNRQAKPAEALPHAERLLARDPENPGYLNLKAAILANLGDYAGSIDVYGNVLRRHPRQPKVWMSMGHALKTARRQEESIAAYRRAIEMEPTLGEAYWSLANLKTVRFSEADRAAMQDALRRDGLQDEDRIHLEFALGKALEDAASYEQSFVHYVRGNELHRRSHPYSADENSAFVTRSKQQYSTEFFAARSSQGAELADPIFIVGLPRAGSTLLEQILASHTLVEGTIELPDIPQIARELMGRDENANQERFFEAVAALTPQELRSLGEHYLVSTRVHRKTAARFFIDKMPNNFLYVGLIQLILPNAKIIDARRHPLGCGFSAFKQHFARGQNFTYDLGDLGRYYADYVELMAHFDAVMPGRVHRVFYESLVHDTEGEVRRLLDYCGLPFEERCLRFYENERPVRTASSEQVRQPIFTDGMDHWRHYEPWLGPLKLSLGPALASYPRAPGAVP